MNITTVTQFIANSSSFEDSLDDKMNTSAHDASYATYIDLLDDSRFIVQRVLVPIVMVIGVVGNSITITILTRRHMQSSTNCYLTALAVSDMLYLIFVFSLSLQHIPGMTQKRHVLYWHYYRSALWLTDASSTTSIWLTVVFTVERYIAVCYPMKGKVLCTLSRARKIIFAVYFACFALTVTTPFEWRIIPDPKANETHLILENSSLGANKTYQKIFYWFSAVIFILIPLTLLAIFNSFLIVAVKHGRKLRRQMTQKTALKDTSSAQQEQKITIMLIAVVVLALCCQMPTAIVLMYSSFKEIKPKSKEYLVMRILGNIFNFLTTLNAASNFILYCVMSDRYRKTFIKTFCKKRRDSTFENSAVSGTSYVGMSVQNSFKFTSSASVNKSSNNRKRSIRFPLLDEGNGNQVTQFSFVGETTLRAPITYRTPSPKTDNDRTKRQNKSESDITAPLVTRVESSEVKSAT